MFLWSWTCAELAGLRMQLVVSHVRHDLSGSQAGEHHPARHIVLVSKAKRLSTDKHATGLQNRAVGAKYNNRMTYIVHRQTRSRTSHPTSALRGTSKSLNQAYSLTGKSITEPVISIRITKLLLGFNGTRCEQR